MITCDFIQRIFGHLIRLPEAPSAGDLLAMAERWITLEFDECFCSVRHFLRQWNKNEWPAELESLMTGNQIHGGWSIQLSRAIPLSDLDTGLRRN
ncbi:MAG: hypothetical protein LLG00_11640 [Planctomycetaceae bacterium]|nr:hypothetical protein [Planctomycetaceae bacterium]